MSNNSQQAGGEPAGPVDALKGDLFDLYHAAGRNVRYIADSGEDRPYWPNRYLQALRRAVEDSDAEVLAFVRRMVMSDVPSRGFGYLKNAERLDLTVEWLVYDSSRVYHHLFDTEVIEAAGRRLIAHGFSMTPAGVPDGGLATEAIMETTNGFALELSVEVTGRGAVVLRAGEAEQPVANVLSAVRIFVDLLVQVEAAATASHR